MFSLDGGASGASSALALPLPFMTTCSSGCDSGPVLMGVSSAAAARAACRRVIAPGMMGACFIISSNEHSFRVAGTAEEDRFFAVDSGLPKPCSIVVALFFYSGQTDLEMALVA